MPTIVRSNKASGGTEFTDDTFILDNEVDDDLNTVYTKINGNLDNDNVSASAEVVQSKIADHGTQATATTPGTPGAESAPTTLAGDIERLRYAIAQLKFGNASDQGGALEWFERSPNLLSWPNNICRNSSFIDFQAPASTTAPAQWTASGPAADYSLVAVPAALGTGWALAITGGGGAGHGLTQAFAAADLRPSTTYIVTASAWATSGDFARITTTGGSANVDAETGSTTPVLLQGYFTTDATPSAVTLKLEAKNATDVANFFNVSVVPLFTTPRRGGYQSALLQLSTKGTNITGSALALEPGGTTLTGYANVTDGSAEVLRRKIHVPGPGYKLKVTATVVGGAATSAGMVVYFILVESVDAEVTYTVRDCSHAAVMIASNVYPCSTVLQYTVEATPGATYWYKVMAATSSAFGSADFEPQGGNSDTATSGVSSLLVELIPTGVA